MHLIKQLEIADSKMGGLFKNSARDDVSSFLWFRFWQRGIAIYTDCQNKHYLHENNVTHYFQGSINLSRPNILEILVIRVKCGIGRFYSDMSFYLSTKNKNKREMCNGPMPKKSLNELFVCQKSYTTLFKKNQITKQ